MVGRFLRGIALVGVLVCVSMGALWWEGAEYKIDAPTVTVAWDVDGLGAVAYNKVQAVWIDPDAEVVYGPWITQENQFMIARPRAGHFRIEVSSCNALDECSEWAVSTDARFGQVDGEAKGWRIYWKLAKPTGPVIN